MTDPIKIRRCAVYTRKSTEEGLDQAFNSLDAQREACEAFILSQKHEGWILVPTSYDDGGFSGGNMNRPGLKHLIADVAAGKIDVVAVYKVDRLTRSLADFAKIIEQFDAKGVSFVSVTQAFNTTSSMGRLTLNVLLSFAQFEREVTGERIRDKIAASKAKGMWMGGPCPLGYDVIDKQLVPNEVEAEQVRTLFKLYLASRSADQTAEKATALGLKGKLRNGRQCALGRSVLYRILSNPVYAGDVAHRGKRYPGQHQAIVEPACFERAQQLLAANRRRHRSREGATHRALLAGLVTDEAGNRLVSTHTSKGPKRYRYYCSVDGSLRVPAAALEKLVVSELASTLGDPTAMATLLLGSVQNIGAPLERAAAIAAELQAASEAVRARLIRQCVETVEVTNDKVTIALCPALLIAKGESTLALKLTRQVRLARQKGNLTLVLDGDPQPVDEAFIRLVAQGRTWFDALVSGEAPSIHVLARREGIQQGYVRRAMYAALIPSIRIEQAVQAQDLQLKTAEA